MKLLAWGCGLATAGGRMPEARESDPEFAAAVRALLRANGAPSRRSEPRLAPRLVSTEKQSVGFREGSVAAWRLGDGDAVLLVHGWEDDHSLWAPLIDALAERGRSIVAFDMPAHGFSEGEWGLHPHAGDAILAVAHELGPIDAVVGHSAGASIAALALREGLDADRLALVAPPLGRGNRWLRIAERLGYSQDVASAAQATYEDGISRTRVEFDLRTALPTLDVDLLVIHSLDDERMPFSDSRDVVPRCRRAELLAVSGLSHRRTARDPDVVRRITDFVSGRLPS
jgi:pimeloyl-ACP methyl ester carboxylesterase